jgi:acetyl coenzyme A synthetase (ADP forming)-like protein
MDRSLIPFFNPAGIVAVGVSQNPNKLGYGLARNIISCGYPGEVYFVNFKGGELFGHPIFKSIGEVPKRVDLAILMIPADDIPHAILECGTIGIKAAIILSGGFGEVGEEGAALERACLQNASTTGIRIIGPNCIGLIDTHLPIDTTFLPPPSPVPGDISFVSHSGAICAIIIDWARGQGFSFSRLVSLGNQIDVNETEVLPYIAADENTHVITLYLEGVKDGRRFIDEVKKITKEKPIVAIKAGRYEGGKRAVSSHTGALAGQDVAFDAAFRRAGLIRASSIEEMFDWAKTLAWCSLPNGNRVAVLTNAGGPGVTGVDALELFGLTLASLSFKTKETLKKILPPAASISNPVDMLASASPDQYAQSLNLILSDDGVDSVMLIIPPPPMFTAHEITDAVIPIIQSAKKPVVVSLMGDTLITKAVERFRIAKIPEYRFPEKAASAIAVLSQQAVNIKRPEQKPLLTQDIEKEAVNNVLEMQEIRKAGFLSEIAVLDILSAYGLPTCSISLAKTSAEASRLAQIIGFPIALKVFSPDIIHKSDSGGVILDLSSPEEVVNGFNAIMNAIRIDETNGEISGIYVQKMIKGGQEVIVGAIQDPQFGAMVMFGAGGVEVERERDVAFSLAPSTDGEIDYLLENTMAGRRMKGFRNIPEVDVKAVRDVLVRVGQLAADFPQIKEIDINPLIVMPKGEGAIIVDARIKI